MSKCRNEIIASGSSIVPRSCPTCGIFSKCILEINSETGESESTMERGYSAVDTLRLNGWSVGDILEGDEGHGPDRILITAIGQSKFLCRWDYGCKGVYAPESGNTTLAFRIWTKVGAVFP